MPVLSSLVCSPHIAYAGRTGIMNGKLLAEELVSFLVPSSVYVSADLVIGISALALECCLSHSERWWKRHPLRICLGSLCDLVPLAHEVLGQRSQRTAVRQAHRRKASVSGIAAPLRPEISPSFCANPESVQNHVAYSSVYVGGVLVNAHHVVVLGNGVDLSVNAVGERHISNICGSAPTCSAASWNWLIAHEPRTIVPILP